MLSGEYPEGSLREVVSDTDSDGVALALTDLVVNLAHVPGLSDGVVAVTDEGIGSFDVPPLHSGMLREWPI